MIDCLYDYLVLPISTMLHLLCHMTHYNNLISNPINTRLVTQAHMIGFLKALFSVFVWCYNDYIWWQHTLILEWQTKEFILVIEKAKKV